jgi:hypothetical protein
MLQAGQYLPLLTESLAKQIGRQGHVDEFDRYLLLEVPVGAVRKIDGAHSAAAQQAIDLVRPNPLAIRRNIPAAVRLPAAACHHPLFRFTGLQQRARLIGQRGVRAALSLDQFRSLFMGSGQSLGDDRLNPVKPFGG